MRDSDGAWRRWGEIDPYYGVLSNARYRKDGIAAHRDDFFALGEGYVAERLSAAERHFGSLRLGRALDFGCGVGRLTLPLARRFEAVTGLDIAPAMLAEAERNAAAAGLANVDFCLSDDRLSAAPGPFDLVLSCIVLQHIPVARGMAIIARLLERVAPGGVVSLQFVIDRKENGWRRLRYWARMHVPGADALFRALYRRPAGEPTMQMNEYPLARVLALADAYGFGPALVGMERHGAIATATVLARRERLLERAEK